MHLKFKVPIILSFGKIRGKTDTFVNLDKRHEDEMELYKKFNFFHQTLFCFAEFGIFQITVLLFLPRVFCFVVVFFPRPSQFMNTEEHLLHLKQHTFPSAPPASRGSLKTKKKSKTEKKGVLNLAEPKLLTDANAKR